MPLLLIFRFDPDRENAANSPLVTLFKNNLRWGCGGGAVFVGGGFCLFCSYIMTLSIMPSFLITDTSDGGIVPPRSTAIANLEVISGLRAAKLASILPRLPPRAVHIANLEVIGERARKRVIPDRITTQIVWECLLCGIGPAKAVIGDAKTRRSRKNYHTDRRKAHSVW